MFQNKVSLKKGDKELISAWTFYDWANSVYPLVISSTIFPIYYALIFDDFNYIDFFGYEIKNTAMISFVTALAFLVIVFIIPFLSGIADYLGNKKIFMKFFVYVGSVSCIALYWFNLETIYIGLFFYFIALIGYWSSLVFYNSYLPEIAYNNQQDSASAKGFAMGYIGSIILLLLNLLMVMKPSIFGISGSENEVTLQAMKLSFISVGVWWIIFSQIPFYFLPSNKKNNKMNNDIIWNGFKELKMVWIDINLNLNLKRFLGAFFVYSTALQTVMLVATYFGEEEINWPSNSEKTVGLIISILLIQLVAVIGAMLSSKCSELYGNLKTLIFINIIWALICFFAFYIHTPFEFYIIAGFVGLVMGALQPLSRSTYSKFLPETNDTASYFSFYGVTEKIAIIIGMSLFGVIDQITGSMRNSIFIFLILFLIGAYLLFRIYLKNKDSEN